MLKAQDVTLCLTIGRRPDLLRQTLNSLLTKISFEQIIAINDFRDEATNIVFRELCPNGILIHLENQLGHHRAVDTMYEHVKTNYIFHCEDDWQFDQIPDIPSYKILLEHDSQATSVCLRKWQDFPFSTEQHAQIQFFSTQPLATARLEQMHEQWHGYTFNPHFSQLSTWKSINKFANFKKERHISRWFRAQGKYVLFLKDGICQHIGEDFSVANKAKTSFWAKWKGKIFG